MKTKVKMSMKLVCEFFLWGMFLTCTVGVYAISTQPLV